MTDIVCQTGRIADGRDYIEDKPVRVVTFGEVMIRLAPEEFLRLGQVLPGRFEATFGGGELNVAVSIAHQGGQSAFLSSLPNNPLTDCLEQEMRKFGVDTGLLRRVDRGRFGIYFVETGANQRGGTVTYDRDGTSIALEDAAAYDFDSAFAGAGWLHITGITPAISQAAAGAALEAVQTASRAGLTVSCDLNFRKKLWNWQSGTDTVDLARDTMRGLVPFIDVVIANEEDCDLCLGIRAEETDVEAGHLNVDAYQSVARKIVTEFPNVSTVAITLRESYSASHNNWGAMLLDTASDTAHFAPLNASGDYQSYEMHNIVDRVGAGDSFAGGLIFAMTTPELSEPETALRYATAASCLKHSIKGDFSYAQRPEIESLMGGSTSGRVSR
ncbi:MAG: sugar kinase [Planctomycetota bacterium]|nr:sugar kinase [Planctomycetota bacterium]MED5398936.1 sugar kinase [Planctomycetota bacterium]MEE3364802.1 sugar kinase [Planctomycetota bacterium]